MLYLILGLLAAGILLIAAEVFIPGGVVSTAGGACILGGLFLAFQEYGAFGALVAGFSTVLLSFAVVILELKLLPRTKTGRRMFNQSASSGVAVDTGAATSVELIGKHGRTLTTCAPTGMAEIEGRRYEASSIDGLLRAGENIIVAGRDNYKLLVKKAPESL